MSKITTIGLDIAKNSFAAHGFDVYGKTVLKKELKRGQVLAFFAKHEGCLVGASADEVGQDQIGAGRLGAKALGEEAVRPGVGGIGQQDGAHRLGDHGQGAEL